MNKSILFLLSILIVAVLALAGCGNDAKNDAKNNANGEASDKALVYATSKDINDMNPHLYAGSIPAQGMVFESLVENTKDGIKPSLAESWDISEDGKTYTFHLRQGVVFHDGAPFDAEAAKLNIDAVQANASKHAWIKLSTKIVSVDVVDTYTIKLALSEPYYPTLLELAMTRPYAFLSPRDFKNGGTKDGVIGYHGTGPYQLAEHQAEQYATFTSNEHYWNGAPKIKRITAKVLPAGETTFLALQKGEVNFIFTDDRGADSIDVASMTQLTDSGDYRLVRSEPMNTKMLAANSGSANSPIRERAVREAIWYSVDRETIGRDIFGGTEKPADALFSPNVNYADIELPKRAYDPEKAATMLTDAGWIAGKDGEVRTKNGVKLNLKLYYDANSPSQKTQAEFIQSTVGEIGVGLALVGEASASIASRRASGDYDLLFNQTWGLAYDPLSTIAAFTSEAAYLHTTEGMANAQDLYAKIDAVTVSADETARRSLYGEILKSVHDEAVFIPLTHGNVTVVAPRDLQGIAFKQTQYELPFEQMYFE
ncbi:nickel ABC transporter substrate-binding protein [Cohnella sp. GbtcB17]|uniref:staphylopine-dependent metal ABC transporter substrate-binding lipoprotein n=1 Tax=Cohnella sp. GbtcB17 TaxID=2824762 RepID=UPI001C2FC630|nr:nickel ABC transporter substrate-binding protein [Cohnella sp. GbtcB17]